MNEKLKGKYFLEFDNSFHGQRDIRFIASTEREVAIYFFFHQYYRLKYDRGLASSSPQIWSPEGQPISSKILDDIIKKHFPKETALIDKRITLGSNPAIYTLMNWGLIDYWLAKEEKIIKDLPLEIQQEYRDIKAKSEHTITYLHKPEKKITI